MSAMRERVRGLVCVWLISWPVLGAWAAEDQARVHGAPRGDIATMRKESRLALVIGNSAYPDAPLANPANDARDMAATLRSLGFEVLHEENVNEAQMVRVIRRFGDKLHRQRGVGLFYFAGHGVQVGGRNYLIPVGTDIQQEDEVAYQSVAVGQVLAKMERAGNRVNVLILDACRDNPFPRSFRSSRKGLAKIDKAPSGTVIGFATGPGDVARDDSRGDNGLYTYYLLQHLTTPELKLEEVLKRVREDVSLETAGKQMPWDHSSLIGDFYFVLPEEVRQAAGRGSITRVDPLTVELAFWDSIEDSDDPALFQAYLEKYPQGAFASIAKRRVEAPRGPKRAQLVVRSNVVGDTVYISGKPYGPTSPTPIELPPGDYTVRVETADRVSAEEHIALAPGARETLRFVLRARAEGASSQAPSAEPARVAGLETPRSAVPRRPASTVAPLEPVPSVSTLSVSSNVSRATVFVDDEKRTHTGAPPLQLPPGIYTVRAEKQGYQPWTEDLILESGDHRRLFARLEPEIAPATKVRVEPITVPPAKALKPRVAKTWVEPLTGMEFVRVPAGCFEMGSPSTEEGRYEREEQWHRTCVESFWLGKYEVTNKQYRMLEPMHGITDFGTDDEYTLPGTFTPEEPSEPPRGDEPAVLVSVYGARRFAAWIEERTGHRLRLPTEAEWEYAARAKVKSARFWGDEPDRACQFANVGDLSGGPTTRFKLELQGQLLHQCRDGYSAAAPVGRFKPNGFGLYDMLGNVSEWTCSEYETIYRGQELRCGTISEERSWEFSEDPDMTTYVVRGGSWGDGARNVRSANRKSYLPGITSTRIGFRLARIE